MSSDGNPPSPSGQPSASVDSTMDEGRRYWKAAIAHLGPEKREAAWEFYLDRLESSAAADTLGGVMLLLEAHLAFFDDLPARLGLAARQIEAASQASGSAGLSAASSSPSIAPDGGASRPGGRRKSSSRLFVGFAAVVGGIVGCAGTIAYQCFRSTAATTHPNVARDVFLTRAQPVGIEPWNDPATGRRKGCIVHFSNVAAAERSGSGEARIYVLSPVEEVRENVHVLQQLAH